MSRKGVAPKVQTALAGCSALRSQMSVICRSCQSDRVTKKGLSSSGKQRWLCHSCKKSFTGNAVGRPTIKKEPLTTSQIQKRHQGTKIHFQKPGSSTAAACGVRSEKWQAIVTHEIDRVNCKLCQNTICFKSHSVNHLQPLP